MHKDWDGKKREEVEKKLRDLREEIFHLRVKKASAQLDKTHRLGELRREIARGETVLRMAHRQRAA